MGSTSFLGLSCPNLLLVFLNFLFLGTRIIFFSQVLGLSLGLFISFLFSFLYLIDHGNSFLCLEEESGAPYLGSAYLQSMDCQREPQSNIQRVETPGYTL